MRDVADGSTREAKAMVASLCAAFADDPGLIWLWPEREDRLRRLPYFFRPLVRGARRNGVALTSGSGTAASLWRLPGHIDPSRMEILFGLRDMIRAIGPARERAQMMRTVLDAHRPKAFDWWYLQFIGVHPSAQGTGLGAAVMQVGLERARAANMPVYVEVMNPANMPFYRAGGFQTVAEFDIPDGGPHVCAMIAR